MSEARGGRYDMAAIRGGLAADMGRLAETLFPHGRRERARYWPVNHVRGDRQPGSMVIDVAGPTAGRWIDYADGEAKGDALALIAYAQTGSPRADGQTIAWAAKWLGLERGEARAPSRPPPPPRASHDVAAERDAKARRALGWWLKGEKLPGTLGERYLARRGVRLSDLGFAPGAIRFHRALRYPMGDGAFTEFPGLLTAMTNGAGKVRAVHRTFLDARTANKAPVKPAKKMWGDVAGTSIRLSKGAANCAPEEAARQGLWGETLAIGEGIEDMLNWSLLYPDHRTAAFGALSLLANCPVYESVERVVIVRDNDENPKTRADFERGVGAFQRANRHVRIDIAEPQGAKDINELWAKT